MENTAKDRSMDEITEMVRQRQMEERKLYGKPKLVIQGIESEDVLKALHANEVGDSWLLTGLLRDQYCYDHAAGNWYKWNGVHWEMDLLQSHIKAVDVVVEEYQKEVERQARRRGEGATEENENKKEQAAKTENKLIKRIGELQSLKRRTDVLKFASSGENSLGINGNEWDRNPFLLGCANGVTDLTTGEMRKACPSDYILMASPVSWKHLNEPCPIWDRFLLDVFNGDLDLVGYFHRLVGCAVIGDVVEHILAILYGEGGNGKGTTLEVLSYVFGPLAGPIPSETLLSRAGSRSGSSASPDIMRLRGMRMAWASETNEGRFLDAARLKWLVGGDTLIGRELYGKRLVQFAPTHTLFLLTNHKPHASADDGALWRRVHLIPFVIEFKYEPDPNNPNQKPRDGDMKKKLQSEASGILAWAVRGALAYQREGLNPPEVVKAATREYQNEEDILGHFINDICSIGPGKLIKAKELYSMYRSWCESNGHIPVTNTNFGRKMVKRFDRKDSMDGRYYLGVSRRESSSFGNKNPGPASVFGTEIVS